MIGCKKRLTYFLRSDNDKHSSLLQQGVKFDFTVSIGNTELQKRFMRGL